MVKFAEKLLRRNAVLVGRPVGFELVEFVSKPELAGYYAQFKAVGQRPTPDKIVPCGRQGQETGNAPG